MSAPGIQPDLLEQQRIRRFAVVGLSSTALDLALLAGLKTVGLSTLPANTLAYALATIYNFVLSRSWTYAGGAHKPVALQFGQFVITGLISIALNDLAVVALEACAQVAHLAEPWSYVCAKLGATALVAIWSYVTNRLWVFSDDRQVTA